MNSTTFPWGSALRCALLLRWWGEDKTESDTHLIFPQRSSRHHHPAISPSTSPNKCGLQHESSLQDLDKRMFFLIYISQLFGATFVVRVGIHWLDKCVFMCWVVAVVAVEPPNVLLFKVALYSYSASSKFSERICMKTIFCVSSSKSSASVEPLA